MSKAVVLLSGGIDSTVALMVALRDNKTVSALSMRYGQKHERESRSATRVAAKVGVKLSQVTLPNRIFAGSKSALIDPGTAVPTGTYEEITPEGGPAPTMVPFRNAVFLSIAVAMAATERADRVYIGAHESDAAGWSYPDCTPEFFTAMREAVRCGMPRTDPPMHLEVPFLTLDKAQVVHCGLSLGAPFELTYSCYSGKVVQCGECATCLERIAAFQNCEVRDPVQYAVKVSWEGCASYNTKEYQQLQMPI